MTEIKSPSQTILKLTVTWTNFDVKWVYMDDLIRIVRKPPHEMKELFDGFNELSEKFNVDFYVSIEGDPIPCLIL